MKRRTALRNIVLLSAGAVLLPVSCRQSKNTGMALKHISVDGPEQDMLAELTETIIPKTNNFLGAKDIKSHEFLLTMVDDCHSPEQQKIFTDGLKAFENACDKKFNASFVKCAPGQRSELLKEMEANIADENNPAAQFYKITKSYTIQNFTSCKEYMLDIRKWKMVPGSNFRGCVKV